MTVLQANAEMDAGDVWATASAARVLAAVPDRVSRIVGLEQVFPTHSTAQAAENAWALPVH
ncbi:hypothetical protein ACFWVP_19380 [Streptomyces sp. NPDC058637]|uniref:hypothetical protein n=1 Tax=Streptomyces sp. NPDC058637 TaxID=3346569 RepID=UPI0036546BDA